MKSCEKPNVWDAMLSRHFAVSEIPLYLDAANYQEIKISDEAKVIIKDEIIAPFGEFYSMKDVFP